MKRVAVSIGHNPVKPGYRVGKFSEYSEMAPVAGLLVQELMYLGIQACMVGTGSHRSKVEQVNSMRVDLAIELHLNAGSGVGVETLYCPGSTKGMTAAAIIHDQVKGISPRDRGIKEGWYRQDRKRGPVFFLAQTNCPAIITETYFMDNQTMMDKFADNLAFYGNLAERLAAGVTEYLELHP